MGGVVSLLVILRLMKCKNRIELEGLSLVAFVRDFAQHYFGIHPNAAGRTTNASAYDHGQQGFTQSETCGGSRHRESASYYDRFSTKVIR